MDIIDERAREVVREVQIPLSDFNSIVSCFVHLASDFAEIEYRGSSYTLLDLDDAIDIEKVDDIGDEIARQIYSDVDVIDFAGKACEYLSDGTVISDDPIAQAMWKAVVGNDEDENDYLRAARKAHEEIAWDVFVNIDDDLNVDVTCGRDVSL